MKKFKIDTGEFQAGTKKTVIYNGIVFALMLALPFVLFYMHLTANKHDFTTAILSIYSLFSTGIYIYGMQKLIQSRKIYLDSYELLIGKNDITQFHRNNKPISFKKEEIEEIFECGDRTLKVRSSKQATVIEIPASIGDRQELIDEILSFSDIQKPMLHSNKLKSDWEVFWDDFKGEIVTSLVSLSILWRTQNNFVLATYTCCLISVSIYTINRIRKHPSVNHEIEILSYTSFSLVLLTAIGRIAIVILG